MNSFVVLGTNSGEVVRFAVSRSAINTFGWDACMVEAFRRLRNGERDFGLAPMAAAAGMASWRIVNRLRPATA
jgi:hypothetical protein